MRTDISFKRIQQLAIPAILSGIAEPVLSSTDAAVVGNIPDYGTESLAAVGIVGSFLSMLIWILAQSRSAISAIVSQNLGAGKIKELNNFPAQAIYFNIALSIIVLLSTYYFVEEIFGLLNAEGIILEYSIDYYNIRVWGFPLTLFTFAVFGLFRGLQNTFWPMTIATTGAVVNIGLDFALVYGIEDYIAPMGIKGAAWASLISQAIMALMALIFILRKTDVSLRLRFPLHPEISRLVQMSINLFIRSIALNAALMLAVREATGLGKEYIAAHAIAINIWLFSAFFVDGYGAAGNILGGKLLGEKDYTTLWKLTRRVNLYNLFVAGVLVLVGLLFYKQLGLLFNKDAEVLAIFYGMFFMVLISQPLNALGFTLDAIFKGLGEMRYLRNVLLGATIIGFVPVLFLARYMDWGLTGIWMAILVWVAYRAVALIIKYRNKYLPLVEK
ncbi:MAG: MATE family efflux transporter [Bacteroidia bacterium]|nr:MATE family efflux transporter [Bacteroidia bacterium]NNF31433.1 MATE family efflux transporter [Flavobacteriaceae bacterium]NNJ80893.1 MATE family efflux transporter [Flavobacteriaceae bacterium]NNK54012.1 MATE family efflux transporter [Flavobacteriaceae bacterium]NNM07589.1 MATE family efflux transporter [Flavobacteriaceae bacterium]